MRSWRSSPAVAATILALTCGGFALTVWIFYPGIMTYDARYVHADIAKGVYGDWQSPVMTALWGLIDPLAPGSASIFLFDAALYWGAFALLALHVARTSRWAGLALPVLALTPSAFAFVGIIWRDVLLANVWLLAAVLLFASVHSAPAVRLAARLLALALIGVGVLLRPNALLAAPLLAGLALWPASFSLKRAAVTYVPAAILSYALIPLVYYGVFHAERQHVLHALFVYDLGGITHFSKQNQFPVTWTPEEEELVEGRCYSPEFWDVYWTMPPCSFVMGRLESEKVFGTPVLTSAWLHALVRHPLAYLQHRFAVFWNYLAGSNLTMFTVDIEDPARQVFPDRPAFAAFKSLHDALKPTPLFRTWAWLVANILLCAAAWLRRDTPAGAYAIGVCGSAVAFVLTYFVVGVSGDFRYGLWAVVAAVSAAPVLLTARRALPALPKPAAAGGPPPAGREKNTAIAPAR